MKKILFAASECVPFIKTGGLADVAGSLPKYFDKSEYDCRVILPKYATIKEPFRSEMKYLFHFYMDLNWRMQYVGVFTYQYDGITFYFIDNEEHFGGQKPYDGMPGDLEKFALFSKAVLSVLPLIDFRPDIIHCHDWQTGLVPVYLNERFQGNPFYRGIKSIMTIHNLKFQGIWNIETIRNITGLSDYYFTSDKLEYKKDANYLKGGLVYANAITTVSNTYAEEIKTEFYGEGLDGLMRAREKDLSGIVNGIDYDVYDPKTDKYIAANFDTADFSKKAENKLALQKELGLEVDASKMLIGVVSRLTDQKGFDLIAYMMEELSADDVQYVILGTGEAQYENMFRYYASKYPGKISANITYSEPLSHKIYAACDAFLMLSLFEPCGLSQLMSLRYGTLPIVRETGGLKDTVQAYNEYAGTGTGFSFTNYNAHEMANTIRYAEKVYYQTPEEWVKMAKRAMETDFSWVSSAKQYEALYESLCK